MIPILFEQGATDFSTNGIGRLSDVMSCTVEEERNGMFELTMTYPSNGTHANEIECGSLIVVKPNLRQNRQAFEVYKIEKGINQIMTIYAQHISYRLNFIPVRPFTATGIQETIQGLASNVLEDNPFTLTSDFVNDYSQYNQIEPKQFRACLGGTQGSILDVFSSAGAGEYLWDNFSVSFLMHRGQDNGVQLRYAKNITDLKEETNNEKTVTGAIAFWYNEEQNIFLYGETQLTPFADQVPVKKTVLLDVSEDMDEIPSLAQLNSFALSYVQSLALFKQNIKVSFIDIWDSPEYSDFAQLESVNLCDTVRVIYEPLGITMSQKVIRTVFDVLTERYNEIEIGDSVSSLAQTLSDNIGDIEEIVKSNSRLVSVVQNVDRELGEVSSTIASVSEDVEGLHAQVSEVQQTSDSFSITIQNIQTQVENNATGLDNYEERLSNVEQTTDKVETHFTFGTDGLTIQSSESAEYSTIVDNTGMRVVQGEGASAQNVLVANKDGVNANDLTARNYLIIDTGTYKSRFQKYGDSYDSEQLGCYWIEEG